MPSIDLSILNQKATPSFYADTLANRPAPSFVGRVFISTDTYDLYRDTGTAWVLLSPSSTGTITGSGAAGQVTIFSGASSITGTNNLFWDTTNLRLGINNNTPGASLDVHSATGIVAQLNVTTATNNTELAFQNAGSGKWRIGNSYNAGANDFQVYDVVNSLQRFSVLNTGQTFVGAQTSSSGKLVVNQTASDNGIVLIGTTAPSIRVRNLGVAPTQQFGLGLSTGVNNFIQGSASGDFCIFNSSTTASPILLGIYNSGTGNVEEGARLSASKNFLVGQTTDTGQTLQVTGSAAITGITQFSNTGAFVGFPGVTINQGSGTGIALSITKAGNNEGLYINKTSGTGNAATILGNVGIGTTLNTYILQTSADGIAGQVQLDQYGNVGSNILLRSARGTSAAPTASQSGDLLGSIGSRGYDGTNFSGGGRSGMYMYAAENFTATNQGSFLIFGTTPIGTASRVERVRLNDNGNLLIGTTTDAGYKLQVNGNSYLNGISLINQTSQGSGGTLSINGTISIGNSSTGSQSEISKNGMKLTTGISTSATIIFTTFTQGLSSAAAGYFIIYGGNNINATFLDIVACRGSLSPVVISSTTLEGVPALRTYTSSGADLILSMSSGTYNVIVKCTTMGYPF